MFRYLRKVINQPDLVGVIILTKLGYFLPDKLYLKVMFLLTLKEKLNIKNPITYNEKIQWLKLYNRNPKYTKMVDKIAVKEYVASKIGEKYIIPTIEIYENPSLIDFSKLPNSFVLKCNHNSSSGVYICKDKFNINQDQIRKTLSKAQKQNFYKLGREWPYKNVEKKILAEKYMVDESGYELKDYKFFTFNGKVKALFIASDRYVNGAETKFDFFDENFNHLPFINGHPNAIEPIKCPKSFEKMKELASKLSEGIPHLRVDFYDINGQIYFGELTFYHHSGFVPFIPKEYDYIFGNYLTLPKDNSI